MGIADDMKRITEDIMDSRDARAKGLGVLVAATRKELQGFAADRKKMADNLKESLKKGETDRLKDFKSMRGDINKGIKDIETYVAEKLKEFHDAHAEMSRPLKKDLAKYVADIAGYVKKLLGEYSSEMANARAAWRQGMAGSSAESGNGGEKTPVAAQTVEKKSNKRGRKKGK